MIVRSLALRNYRSVRKLDLDFPESGLLGIVGDNGAGKSSILEAIAWALYGSQAIKPRKTEGLTTVGEKGCKVVLEFDQGGSAYVLTRTLKNAKLVLGSKEIASMTSGVNEHIVDLLNMDYKAFFTSIYTRQGDLSGFTDMKPAQRQETLERLLDVTKADKARMIIGGEARDIHKALEIKRSYTLDEEQIKSEIKNIMNELETLNKTLGNLETNVKGAQKKRRESEKKRNEMKMALEDYQKLERSTLELEKEIEISQNNVNNLKTNMENVNKDIREKAEMHKEIMDVLKKPDPEEQMKKAEGEIADIEKLINNLREKREITSIQLARYEAQIGDRKTKLKQIEKLGPESKCPLCLRTLEEHGPNAVKIIRKEIETLQSKVKPEELEEIKKQRDIEQKRRRAKDKRIDYLVNELRKRRESQAQLLALRLGNVSDIKFEISKKMKEWNGKLEKQKMELGNTRKKIKEFNFNKKEYEKIEDDWDVAGDFLLVAQRKLEEHKGNVKAKNAELKYKERELERIEKIKKEIEEETKKLSLLNFLEQRLREFRTYLTGRIAPILAKKTSERMKQITQGKYSLVEVDPTNYSIKVYDGSESFPLERFSGGEVDAFNLAFRLSISDIIVERQGAEMGMIVLDEVLGSQDYQRQTAVLQGLERISQSVGQVILVTHVASVKDQLQNVWSVNLDSERGTVVQEV